MKIAINNFPHRHPDHTHLLLDDKGLVILAGNLEQVSRVHFYLEKLIK